MGYTNAIDVLPLEVIEQIQKYISGTVLYIPKTSGAKLSWGECTSTREELATRNAKIYSDFINGVSVCQLSQEYYLTSKSIQRIIRQERNKS